jgi:putative hemolysin
MKYAFLLALPLLAVVSPTVSDAGADGSESTSFGLPNPAAQHCIGVGGIVRAVDRDGWGGPQLGLCRLKDDGVIDEWTLFRASHGQSSQAVDAFALGHWVPMPEPIESWAALACASAGGVVVDTVKHLRPSSAIQLCEFLDGSSIELWTMFGGPGLYPGLARRLGVESPGDSQFWPCPWPRTCMAPCIDDAPPQGLCRLTSGEVLPTTFACCCCGSGVNSFAPLSRRKVVGRTNRP